MPSIEPLNRCNLSKLKMCVEFNFSVITFIQVISIAPLKVHCYPEALPSTDAVPEFHAEAQQAIASEGFVQGPYMAARAGFKPATPERRQIYQ